MHARRLITISVALGLVAGLLVTGRAVAATPERILSSPKQGRFQPAADGPFLAWEQNSKKKPGKYNVYVRGGGLQRTRVNARRQNAANGGIDGTNLVFQQYKGKKSDIKMFDLNTLKRSNAPKGVNTKKHWEYWPSMSNGKLLFGRLKKNGTRRLFLFNLDRGIKTLLDRTSDQSQFLSPGQVNDDHVVWSKCTPDRCHVFLYETSTRIATRLPNPGKFQRAPSVSSNGTVYFIRSNKNCGRQVALMRYFDGKVTRLHSFPEGRDSSDTYANGSLDGLNKVYYENSKCGVAHRSDILKLNDQAGFDLSVETIGNGIVTSDDDNINCGADCTELYDPGATVTLTATPGDGSTFDGWSGGGCTGTGPCVVTMDASKTVVATFLGERQLTVTKDGTGTGNVFSSPGGINCGSDCSEIYEDGTVVTLTASPTGNSDFGGWSGGGCSGTGTCVVTMDSAQTVTATFTPKFTLVVSRTGTGNGTVTSTPDGIHCGFDCDHTYPPGTEVTLNAFPVPNSTFTGWSGGGCAGTGHCTVTITETTVVTATFTSHQLTTQKSGSGSGTVTSNPAGIDCGSDCHHMYKPGSEVELTATPAADSLFDGWIGGGCSGANPCVVTMDAAKTVTAIFEGPKMLTVNKSGNGTGTVTSDDGGINCGTECTEPYQHDAEVELTAIPEVGSVFDGWIGGGCTGTGTCVVAMDVAKTVTAIFEGPKTLTVDKAGTGTGTVTSDPGGINCGTECTQASEDYQHDAEVELTAEADLLSEFAGWSSNCTVTGTEPDTCVVTMDAAKTVTATFNLSASSRVSLDGWSASRMSDGTETEDSTSSTSFGGGAAP